VKLSPLACLGTEFSSLHMPKNCGQLSLYTGQKTKCISLYRTKHSFIYLASAAQMEQYLLYSLAYREHCAANYGSVLQYSSQTTDQ